MLENGSDSAFNTSNPFLSQQPPYYLSFFDASASGPLGQKASYTLDFLQYEQQAQNVVVALSPADGTTTIIAAVPDPLSIINIHSGFDMQLGQNNTLQLRENYVRLSQSGQGVGALNLAQQAYRSQNEENAIQAADTWIVNSHLINETRFQWRRIRNDQLPSFFTPTVTLQGAFTTGGNALGVVQDHQDVFELQNYSTATAGKHTMRFGTRLRGYRDANLSTGNSNGTYFFASLNQYTTRTPAQYQATVISNPLARTFLFDGALFLQDDWRWKPNFTWNLGLRYEGQNHIHDHADWAPRIAFAWAPGRPVKTGPQTVIRAGYGMFYTRFTVPGTFASEGSPASPSGVPFVIQGVHNNGLNQQNYVVQNPQFYDPNRAAPVGTLVGSSSSTPYIYSIDPHFHAALDMQGGIGIDQRAGKNITLNATYLFTRGVHQYFTNNVTAPLFDPSSYRLVSSAPAQYDYQFQSGGVYRQQQLILSGNVHFRRLSFNTVYTLNNARSDTNGVTSFPSVASKPGLDYGRPSFDIRSNFLLIGTYAAPHGLTFAPLLVAQSGRPYNITIGNDLTGNNQFNARPTYGQCRAADVVSTSYGCLDTNPAGKSEQIIPFGLGTGPANVSLSLRVSQVLGIGPRVRPAGAAGTTGGGSVASQGLSGNQTQAKLDASAPRKYSLTLTAGAINLLNIVNLAPPNGTLLSPLFGKSQSLATGPFANAVPGNRYVFLSTAFSF